jgi:hypothetical protein
MMNELEILRKLSEAAKREKIPEVDVSKRVVAILGAREPGTDRSLAWIAGLTATAAVPIAFMAFQALDYLTDPLVQVLADFKWVTL